MLSEQKMKVKRPCRWQVLLVALSIDAGCSRRQLHVAVDIDDIGSVLSVHRDVGIADAHVRVVLNRQGVTRTILDDRVDRWPTVVEAVAVDDLAAAIVCSVWAPRIRLAFSLRSGEPREFFEAAAEAIRGALRRRYGLRTADLAEFNMDPMEWACSDKSDASSRFEDVIGRSRRLRAVE